MSFFLDEGAAEATATRRRDAVATATKTVKGGYLGII
jgi:hypothetical protein